LLMTFGCTSVVVLGFEDGGTSTGGRSTTNGAASSTGAGTTSGTTGGQSTGTGSAGGTSGGHTTGNTTGGSSSGTTGADLCMAVYCAPSFTCDPTDGICKCSGQDCSGNCGIDSGACLIACDAGDGGSYPILGQGPYAVQMPTAHLGQSYEYTLERACGVPPIGWNLLAASRSLDEIGFAFYQSGQIEGTPTVASGATPFEFEFEAEDSVGNMGVQNYLLFVVEGPSP
jgi:hypothetical protein